MLGDNIFYGQGLSQLLRNADIKNYGGTVFGYQVVDPERYGVAGFDDAGKVDSITEKPSLPASNYAVTGLYFLDETAPSRAIELSPSRRGELEITDLLETYLRDGILTIELMGRGYAWLDTGTHDSLLDSSNFVRTLQNRQGLQVGSPEEIAFIKGWITADQLSIIAEKYEKNDYGKFLFKLLEGNL